MDKMVNILLDALVFRKLNKKEMHNVIEIAVKHSLERGQILSLYGEKFPYVLLVESGSVQILKESNDGGSIVIKNLNSGDIFWGHAVIDEGATPGTIQAYEEGTVVYLMHKNKLLPILKQNVEAVWEVSAVLMKRMREASNTIEQLAFDDLTTRLAKLILEEHGKTENHLQVPRKMTLDEMATRIGTSREVVCRLLYRIRDDDIIEVDRQKFIIKDLDALKVIAKV